MLESMTFKDTMAEPGLWKWSNSEVNFGEPVYQIAGRVRAVGRNRQAEDRNSDNNDLTARGDDGSGLKMERKGLSKKKSLGGSRKRNTH